MAEKSTTVLTIKEGIQLCALRIDELPKRRRVVVNVKKPEMSAKETLELLDRQNKDLAFGEWVVVTGSDSTCATIAHFVALIGTKGPQFQALLQTESDNHKIACQIRKGSEDGKGVLELLPEW